MCDKKLGIITDKKFLTDLIQNSKIFEENEEEKEVLSNIILDLIKLQNIYELYIGESNRPGSPEC